MDGFHGFFTVVSRTFHAVFTVFSRTAFLHIYPIDAKRSIKVHLNCLFCLKLLMGILSYSVFPKQFSLVESQGQ